MRKLAGLAFLMNLLLTSHVFANDIDDPSPLGRMQQQDLAQYGRYQTDEIGPASIAYGALIGLGVDVLYNFMTSQVLSRAGWHWLAVHCSDCRPVAVTETLRRIAVDAPGFIGLGATLGACDSSGYLALRICNGGVDAALNFAIQSAMGLFDRRMRPNGHFADQVAGNTLLAILWNPIFPRGVVMFEGRSTESLVGNGIVEVIGEGLLGGVNSMVVDTASRTLRNEPIQMRDSFVRGFVSNSIEHFVTVNLVGPRMRFSDRDAMRILTYTRARTGLDNTDALRYSDIRMPYHSLIGGSNMGNSFTNQVLLYPRSTRRGDSEFLLTAAHEITHVRQAATIGLLGTSRLYLEPMENVRLQNPLERVPSVISNDPYR